MSQNDTPAAWSGSFDAPVGRTPGLVLLFSGATPILRGFPLEDGRAVIGRGHLPDERLSRAHAEVRLEDGRWMVRDLGSRNGTFADGRRVESGAMAPVARVVRLAHSLFLLSQDVRAFDGLVLESDEMVAGPALGAALAAIRRAGLSGSDLIITGESGSGKELGARAFHGAGVHRRGPFVAVNCATLPEGLAEGLLFGARRGAYSGATADTIGYIQAADGGVLFLDEVGELDLMVQAKLLRVLETREVMPLGAVRPVPVDVRLCWATHRNLRAFVASGRFRADLFYRISSPEVALPPLRDRLEEVPALAARALREIDSGLRPHARLVETCLLRSWPGNLRELLGSVRSAGQRALAAGSAVVRRHHLDPSAGQVIGEAGPHSARRRRSSGGDPHGPGHPDRAAVERAMAEANGNLSAAARALGLHRTQLYRLLGRLQIGQRNR